MAAIRSGVTPACLARCFLRQTGKPSRGSHPLSDIWNHRLLQKSHLHTVFESHSPAARTLLCHKRDRKFLWVNAVAVRHNSSQDGTTTTPVFEASEVLPVLQSTISLPADPTHILTEQIPADSVLSQSFTEQVANVSSTAAEVLQAVAAEPSLVELGLASGTPVGLVQNLLEYIHIDLDIPWWGAIIVGTLFARLAVFPVIVMGQREAAKLHNVMAVFGRLNNRMSEAQNSGNKLEFTKAYFELTLFQNKHNVNPLRGFLVPLVQAPVFISFFIALRKMAELPVPSMQTGGLLWFPDLTAADPFYILPVVVTGTMFFILEFGAESGVENPQLRHLKTVFRIMPFVVLPFTISFPTAVFTYWLTSNCFSLGQVALLRHPLVRERLKIPAMIPHPIPANSDGLMESIRKSWKNAQMARELAEKQRRI
ncbi:mitochondrial inner membrane protein OXA1L-like [Eleginops maclovinus]|uniref:mitochondrial inner membrane protein OXA1L-like n=1 Tax=Eleginops maclovinus TaxID=56733 RepID=UPI00307FE847